MFLDAVGYGPKRWERRACECCGHVRRIRFVPYTKNGTETGDGMYSKLCTACDLLRAARVHERAASHLRMKRDAILSAREIDGSR